VNVEDVDAEATKQADHRRRQPGARQYFELVHFLAEIFPANHTAEDSDKTKG
jgi:hypothetical protein